MVQESVLLTAGMGLVVAALSAAGVKTTIRLAYRMNMMDVPNARSSHATPTPRLGGVPMVLAATLGITVWILYFAGRDSASYSVLATLVFSVSMFGLGFVDDLTSLSPLGRFLMQIVAASLVLWVLIPRFLYVVVGPWRLAGSAWVLLGSLAVVWLVNLYNFMDGIDGLAAGEAVVASVFFCAMFWSLGEPEWAAANLTIAAAASGFLFFNWAPARIFLGDGGSAFLGAFYGMQFVVAHLTTSVPFPILALPFANFILDATSTLLRRVIRKEKWHLPHRSHYYQRMTDLGLTHRQVTLLELAASTISCIAATACVYLNFYWRMALTGAVVVGLILGGRAAYRLATSRVSTTARHTP